MIKYATITVGGKKQQKAKQTVQWCRLSKHRDDLSNLTAYDYYLNKAVAMERDAAEKTEN